MVNYSALSDEELYRMAGINPAQSAAKSSNPLNYAKILGRGLATLPLGAVQAYGDLAPQQNANQNPASTDMLAGLNPSNPLDALKAIFAANPAQRSQAISDVARDTQSLEDRTNYGGLVGILPQIAQTLPFGGTSITGGAATGAALGGMQPVIGSNPEDRNDTRVGNAITGGVVGGAVPAAFNAVKGVKNAVTGMGARTGEELSADASLIKKGSSAAYQKMRDIGAYIKPKAADTIVSSIDNALADTGKMNSRLHGDTISILDDLKTTASKGQLSVEELDQFRKLFRGSTTKNFLSNPEDAFKSNIVIDALDDALDGLKPSSLTNSGKQAVSALNTARSEWQRYKKFDAISDIVRKSDGDANYLKRELKKFLDNPKKTRGFTGAEKLALKQAASLSAGEGIMKSLGKFGFDLGNSRIGNTALPTFGSGLGAGAGGLAAGIGGAGIGGAAVPVVGTAARQGQKYLARGKTENLLRTIEKGAPLGNETIGAAADFTAGLPAKAVGAFTDRGKEETNDLSKLTDEELFNMIGGNPGTVPTTTLLPTPQSANPMEQVIGNAAQKTGVNPDLLTRIAKAESGLNPVAQAPTGTATGLMQINKPTWMGLVNKYGKEHGISMKDISNPEANAVMGARLIQENKSGLKSGLARDPSDGEVYLAHFLGLNGALKLLKAEPFRAAASLFPKEAKKNREIFFKGSTPRTIEEVYQLITGKV